MGQVLQTAIDFRPVMDGLSVRRRTLVVWRDGWPAALLNTNAPPSGRARVR